MPINCTCQIPGNHASFITFGASPLYRFMSLHTKHHPRSRRGVNIIGRCLKNKKSWGIHIFLDKYFYHSTTVITNSYSSDSEVRYRPSLLAAFHQPSLLDLWNMALLPLLDFSLLALGGALGFLVLGGFGFFVGL